MKAVILSGLLTRKAKDWGAFPAYRETNIQVEKLGRMAQEFAKKYRMAVLKMPADKLRKKQGPELHRLTQQSKRVDSEMAQLILEGFPTEAVKRLPVARRGKLDAACKQFVREMNRDFHKCIEQTRAQISAGPDAKKLKD
jgi:hypothetical protein